MARSEAFILKCDRCKRQHVVPLPESVPDGWVRLSWGKTANWLDSLGVEDVKKIDLCPECSPAIINLLKEAGIE